jgi:glycosyltransferase involved in cell wall biosynthesis
VLAVAQCYPHKRLELLVAAGHLLTTRHRPDARLVVAGAARLANYAETVRGYARCLGAAGVCLTGEQTVEELAAWYRSADLFTVVSEHEGFCVPLVEAMEFGLPIVARANTAIPETLGPGGVLLPADAGPSLLAAAWAELLSDEAARAEIRAKQAAHLGHFDADVLSAALIDALSAVGS